MNVLIFTAGGTIDKIYSDAKGTLNFSFGKPAVAEIVEERVRLNFEFRIENLLAKDSLEMTESDREIIRKACADAKEDKILITHGSDTMIDTAKALSTVKGKLIVLTGASQPYRFRESDAEFNIGVALGALSSLKSGVYIAMNGRVYEWDKCKKVSDGRFLEA